MNSTTRMCVCSTTTIKSYQVLSSMFVHASHLRWSSPICEKKKRHTPESFIFTPDKQERKRRDPTPMMDASSGRFFYFFLCKPTSNTLSQSIYTPPLIVNESITQRTLIGQPWSIKSNGRCLLLNSTSQRRIYCTSYSSHSPFNICPRSSHILTQNTPPQPSL